MASIDDIALTMEPGVTPPVAAHLLDIFGSARAVYLADANELVLRAGLRADIASSISRQRFHEKARREMEFVGRNGITAVESNSPLYPALLRECNDYPHVIYIKGDPSVLQAPMLSVVGTRRVTTYGLSACHRLIEQLSQLLPELVVVSGLAFGVDIAAHRAALGFGLRTIGVMATPITSVYPAVHSGVAADMVARGGALATELRSDDSVTKARFLQRNRIVAGMSPGTLVVQSPASGGSMVTAGMADGYQRCLMCPPANIGEKQSEGTNMLLRSMEARMVCSGADILEELGLATGRVVPQSREEVAMSGAEKCVYGYICSHPGISLEELEQKAGVPMHELMGLVLELEFAGHIRSLHGNTYEKF